MGRQYHDLHTVEFFNLVRQTRRNKEEKADLVAFLRQLQGGGKCKHFLRCPNVGKI